MLDSEMWEQKRSNNVKRLQKVRRKERGHQDVLQKKIEMAKVSKKHPTSSFYDKVKEFYDKKNVGV